MKKTIASTCQGCLTNCSILVSTDSGAITGVSGNPASAATQGALCQNVRIAMQQQCDPDRVVYPMRRKNPRKGRWEDPAFERISWDEALDEIADRLIELRERNEGHRVAVAKGRSTGVGELLHKTLPTIYGTPNALNHDSICDQCETASLGCLDGVWDYRDVDYGSCEYLIMWGVDPLASNRWKSCFRRELPRLKRHCHIVSVDPRLSLSGKAAHEWLPIVPGTDAALACALAHVILVEGLWNRAFVGDFRDGINRFAGGLAPVDLGSFDEADTLGLVAWWNGELKDCTPEWAERECGIPASQMRRIAREFAQAGEHAASWTSPGVAMTSNGFYTCMAVHALNGLVGSVQRPGGVVAYPAITKGQLPSPVPFQDEVAAAACTLPRIDQRDRIGFASMTNGKAGAGTNINRLPDAIASADPYSIDTLIGCWCNFAYSAPGSQRWWDALSTVPFYVDITTHVSESTRFADIVLPARHHAFETWGLVISRQGGRTCVSIEQPCVNAPGEAVGDESDVPFMLAQKLAERGFSALRDYYRSIVDPSTGAEPASGSELAEHAVKTITHPFWKDGSWEAFCSSGVFNGPAVEFRLPGDAFATPSGKFEFVSGYAQSMLEDYARRWELTLDEALVTLDSMAGVDRAFMPHYEPPARLGDPAEYPLTFVQHRSHASLEGRAANTPLFQELKGTDPGDVAGDDVVKLHPDDMGKLGLHDGDTVRVVSPQSSITCHARTWEGTRRGVAVKCYGQGHWAYGRVAAADFDQGIPRGGNNNEIVPAAWERITSSAIRHGGIVRVRIERVEPA